MDANTGNRGENERKREKNDRVHANKRQWACSAYTRNCGDYNDIWDAVVERMHRCAKAPLITGQQWARIIFLDNIIMKTAPPSPETSPAPPPLSPKPCRRGVVVSGGSERVVCEEVGGAERRSVCEVNSSRIYGFLLWVSRTSGPLFLLLFLPTIYKT